ncbi:MAG: TolC family protein [bacterium]
MKNRPVFYFLALFVCLWAPVKAQDTVRLTLDSCLRYAYKHNISMLSAELSEERAEATLEGAKMNFFPSLNASASAGVAWNDGRTRSGNYGLNASLPIFDGFNNIRTLQYAKTGREQSELQVKQMRNSVGAQIISAYLTIVMNEEKLAYQQEVLETSRQQKDEGALKYQVGKILESDYKLLEANYLSAESELENTKITIEDNLSTLTKLMGLANKNDNESSLRKKKTRVVYAVVKDQWTVASDELLPPADTVLARSMRNMPDWRLNDIDVELARLNVELARSAMMPSFSLNAALGGQFLPDRPNDDSFAGNASVSLGLSVPIFDRGSTITNFKKSKINLREAELQRAQKLIDLRKEIEDLYREVQRSLNRFRSSEALAYAYRDSYEVYSIKFSEGAVTAVEMLQQQEKYLSALSEWLQQKYSYILTKKQMEINMGE